MRITQVHRSIDHKLKTTESIRPRSPLHKHNHFYLKAILRCLVVPVDEFDVGVALHQDEAAPVPQQWSEGRVGYSALDGAEPAVTACTVDVLWNGTVVNTV